MFNNSSLIRPYIFLGGFRWHWGGSLKLPWTFVVVFIRNTRSTNVNFENVQSASQAWCPHRGGMGTNPLSLGNGRVEPLEVQPISIFYMCQGLNSHYFHIIGDGHQPNSTGLYTHYKDSY